MRFMILVKANKTSEAGDAPRRDAPDRNGEIQRRADESRCDAGGGGAPPQFERRAGQVLRHKANGGPRPLRRRQGPDRRLLAVQRESLDEAIDWVKRVPNPFPGAESEIEIRQVFEADDFGPALTPELRERRIGSQIKKNVGR